MPSNGEDPGVSRTQERLLHRASRIVRSSPARFQSAGNELDRCYSIKEMRARRAAYLRAVRSVPPTSVRRRGLILPDPRRGDLVHWKRTAVAQVQQRLEAALDDVFDLPVPLDRASAERILLLTWLMMDEDADTLEPGVTCFQRIPWADLPPEAPRGGPETGTQRADAPHGLEHYPSRLWLQDIVLTAEWIDKLARALDVLDPDESSPSERGSDHSVGGAAESEFQPARYFPKAIRPRLRKAKQERRISSIKRGPRNYYSVEEARLLWPDEPIGPQRGAGPASPASGA
jgi:hypothetical protein